MTTVPRIGSLASSRRMASTAALSAAFSCPRPRRRAAAIAAASVTRATSSTSTRSRPDLPLSPAMASPSAPTAGRLRCSFSMRITCGRSETLPSLLDGIDRLADRLLGRLVRDHDDERRRARLQARADARQRRARAPLHDALDRDLAVSHALGDRGHGAGPVVDGKPHVVGALVRAELGLLIRLQVARRCDERRHDAAARDVEDVAGHGRGGRVRAPAPGPISSRLPQ